MGALANGFALSVNGQFRGIVQAAVCKAAYDITNESAGTTNHTERLVWAKATMKDPSTATDQMVWLVLQNATVVASGTTFVENDIQFAVNSNVNNVAL